MQLTVLAISLLSMSVIAYFFIAAVRAGDQEDVTTSPETSRSRLIWGMVVAGVAITGTSLWEWPHRISTSEDTVTINATGAQWYWEIDNEEVPLNRTVVFNVHTADVSHGLGVMGPSGRILFQTQAMPGYVNKVEYIFTDPGEYRVVCMEYCGVAHHDMITEFEVVAQEEQN